MSDTTFTADQVRALLTKTAEMVYTLTLTDSSKDLVSLVLNVADTLVDNPDATFDDVVREEYGAVGSGDDPRTWQNWF